MTEIVRSQTFNTRKTPHGWLSWVFRKPCYNCIAFYYQYMRYTLIHVTFLSLVWKLTLILVMKLSQSTVMSTNARHASVAKIHWVDSAAQRFNNFSLPVYCFTALLPPERFSIEIPLNANSLFRKMLLNITVTSHRRHCVQMVDNSTVCSTVCLC